jgi:tRNA pseudouridine38-40 synthase
MPLKADNFLLFIEYDGSGFSGWQQQPGVRTIQTEISKALSRLGFKHTKIVAAGRTDCGVHALRQAVSLSLGKLLPAGLDLGYSLNSVLPPDISVISVERKNAGFNARFKAKLKVYRYDIWNKPWRSVWRGKNTWHIPKPLNTARMLKASRYLLGKHNFSAFDASGSTQDNKTAVIKEISIKQSKGKISVRFTGDRFLYKMVRNIVGTLVSIGLGKSRPERMKEILSSRDRNKAGETAPAKGLFMEEVIF